MLNKGLYEQSLRKVLRNLNSQFTKYCICKIRKLNWTLNLTQSKQNHLAINYIPHCSVSSVVWLVCRFTPSKLKQMKDGWYINKLAEIYICAVIHSGVIRKGVSPKFIELCLETSHENQRLKNSQRSDFLEFENDESSKHHLKLLQLTFILSGC